MYKIFSEIAPYLVNSIEEHLCELENSSWMIQQRSDNEAYVLCGYFDDVEGAKANWNALKGKFKSLSSNPSLESVKEEDWKSNYKQYLAPWSYETLHWVPLWKKDEYKLPNGHVVLWIDAGMAFGTGTHETTQLCAQALLDYKKEKQNKLDGLQVVDAGCGSGILGLSASLLGFQDVYSFDFDRDAIYVSKENEVLNDLNGKVKFEVKGIGEALQNKKADLLMANITADVLCNYSDQVVKAIKYNGWLVLSGILNSEVKQVKDHFVTKISKEWTEYILKEFFKGEWSSLIFIRF